MPLEIINDDVEVLTVVQPPGIDVITVEIPGQRGLIGETGPANELSIGSVTTSAPGGSATAVITGTPPIQILDLTIPRGLTGPAGDQMPANATTATGTIDLAGVAFTPPVTRVLTLTGNVTFTNIPPSPPAGFSGTVSLICKQAASGGPYTINWPAALEWVNDAPPPPLPTTPGSELEVHLFYNGFAWRGKLGGIYYP